MYFLCHDIKYNNTIFSELIGKLPIITVNISFKNVSHNISIKTHGSESRGQEEAGLRDERVSYLQVAPP